MTLSERIARLDVRAQRLAETRKQIDADAAIAAAIGDRRAPLVAERCASTKEGFESAAVDLSLVELPLSLPTREIAFDVPGRLRVELTLDGTATLDVDHGGPAVRGRRAWRTTVLDLDGGRVRIQSSALITAVKVSRFQSRTPGRLILGPFECEGVVSARAIGHGPITARVASDADWALGRLTGADEPAWHESINAGRVYTGHSDTTGTVALGSFWAGGPEWRVLPPDRAPAFDPVMAHWAFVWGTVTGHDKAYDARTGRPADASVPGFYLVKTSDPDAVTVEGTLWSHGAPSPAMGDPAWGPGDPIWERVGAGARLRGSWRRVELAEHPTSVLVEVVFTGTVRAIELTGEHTHLSPDGAGVRWTRRVDLAPYGEAWQEGIDAVGGYYRAA